MLIVKGYGHFYTDYSNRRALTIKEIETIDQIHVEISKDNKKVRNKLLS